MRRETKHLFTRAVDSLVLAVEHFNRPHDRGRAEAVLILSDHAFEMLLKAAIIQRGGKIRKRKAPNTLGFEGCVNACLLDPKVKFLKNEEADALRILNNLRDGAQHHFILISEQQLYLVLQAAVTLFDEVLVRVFSRRLTDFVPQRVLPISTSPALDFPSMMDQEVALIRGMLGSGSRRRSEARAKLRTLALIDGAMRQDPRHPSDADLNEKLGELGAKDWKTVFPGAASLGITSDDGGTSINLRITRTDGIPIHLVPEGDPSAAVVGVRKIDILSFYNLSSTALATDLGISPPRMLAVVRYLKLQQDEESFKEFQIGKSVFRRYSPRALQRIREALPGLDMVRVWEQFGGSMRKKKSK